MWRRMLAAGAPIVSQLSGMARIAVSGYIAGGRATAAAFAAAGHDPLSTEIRPGRVRTFVEWGKLYALGRPW